MLKDAPPALTDFKMSPETPRNHPPSIFPNIMANITQAHTWINAYVVEQKDVIITALPLYHIFSLTAKT